MRIYYDSALFKEIWGGGNYSSTAVDFQYPKTWVWSYPPACDRLTESGNCRIPQSTQNVCEIAENLSTPRVAQEFGPQQCLDDFRDTSAE